MASATLIRLNKDEWQKLPAGHFYNGKYQVGPFTITYEFIVKYMALIHKTEIYSGQQKLATALEFPEQSF